MESYHERKKLLEEKCGKLINSKPYNDSELKENNNDKSKLAPTMRRQIADI